MRTLSAGYEFAHRDDYEGRKVMPSIKMDADTRNIEEISVSADPELYKDRLADGKLDRLKVKGIRFGDYEGMMPEMESNMLAIDDLNHHETDVLIETYKPDIFCAGIKEKYVVQKMGIPLKQLHSYDYSGPYAGYVGAVNFYAEIDRMVNSRVWSYIKSPWKDNPELGAKYGVE